MSDSDKKLLKKLQEATKNLLEPLTSSNEKLLQLLHELYLCLSEVEQSPRDPTKVAVSLLTNMLVAERLFKHSNVDVKVSVAACIAEILRINAPDAPYADQQMKEVLQLIVASFEDLADNSSRFYTKRRWILDIVAKCRICVVMLDLECDGLLIEMFQHFFRAIRDHHPKEVFLCMENIMTNALEESDDITAEMLSPILQFVKEDAEVSLISQRLAEQVLSRCASKLKTYLTEAVKSSGVSVDNYSDVVASICEGTFKENEVVAPQKEDKEKAEEVSTPAQTCVPEKRQQSLSSHPHDSSVSAAASSINENGHEVVSPRRETAAEAGVGTEEDDPVETEAQTHKRARVDAPGEEVKTA